MIVFSVNAYAQDMPTGNTFIPPQFHGGMPKFHEYLNEKLHYPPVMLEKGFEGKILAKIFVRSDGIILNVIPGGKENEFSAEVKRVLSVMPSWTGASVDGIPVDTFIDKYIYFSINDSQIKDDTTVFECLRYKKSKGNGRKVYAGNWDEIQSKIYYDNALDDLYNKNWTAAVDMFIQAERKGLKSIDLYFNRGLAYYKLGMNEGACRDWQKAADLGDEEAKKIYESKCK